MPTKKLGRSIIINKKKRNKKRIKNNDPFGKCNNVFSFRFSKKWAQHGIKHLNISKIFTRRYNYFRFIKIFFTQYTYQFLKVQPKK